MPRRNQLLLSSWPVAGDDICGGKIDARHHESWVDLQRCDVVLNRALVFASLIIEQAKVVVREIMHALDEFRDKCRKQGTQLLLAGVHAQPMMALAKYGLLDKVGEQNMFEDIDDALNRTREIVGIAPVPKPADAIVEVSRQHR